MLDHLGSSYFTARLASASCFRALKRRGIGVAFAYDRHFEIAGFRLL